MNNKFRCKVSSYKNGRDNDNYAITIELDKSILFANSLDEINERIAEYYAYYVRGDVDDEYNEEAIGVTIGTIDELMDVHCADITNTKAYKQYLEDEKQREKEAETKKQREITYKFKEKIKNEKKLLIELLNKHGIPDDKEDDN